MTKERYRDLAAYLALAILVGLGTVWVGFHYNTTNVEVVGRWLAFATTSAILFGYAVHNFHSFWRTRRFIFAISALFLVHVFGYVWILLRTPRWPLLRFVLIYPFESIVVYWVLDIATWRRKSRRSVYEQRPAPQHERE